MHIHIAPNDSLPLYQQIVNQVKYMISSGQLRPGDELPPIRSLSETLIVNANTVARAFTHVFARWPLVCLHLQ